MATEIASEYLVPTDISDTWHIVLHSTEGGSDKLYHINLVKSGDLFLVNFQNGRRGGTMASGTKTKEPVSLIEAKKIADKGDQRQNQRWL